MITPYLIDIIEKGNLKLFSTKDRKIVAYDDEYDEYFILSNRNKISSELIDKPATKKELQEAGLWDLVINKEDFSSIDEELEEYLQIGEEILKNREHED